MHEHWVCDTNFRRRHQAEHCREGREHLADLHNLKHIKAMHTGFSFLQKMKKQFDF